jgi:hypothetical protein
MDPLVELKAVGTVTELGGGQPGPSSLQLFGNEWLYGGDDDNDWLYVAACLWMVPHSSSCTTMSYTVASWCPPPPARCRRWPVGPPPQRMSEA